MGRWSIYGQGKANVLFQNEDLYRGRLARVRKYHPQNPSAECIFNFWNRNFYISTNGRKLLPRMSLELFTDSLKDQLYRLCPDVDRSQTHFILIDRLGPQNCEELKVVKLKYNHGLIKDLNSYTTLEFKPKWLLPSPNVPAPDTFICRNCALYYFRKGQFPTFCSLSLSSKAKEKGAAFVEKSLTILLTSSLKTDYQGPLAKLITDYWLGSGISEFIEKFQLLDSEGILTYNDTNCQLSEKFLTSMAARDCTVIIGFNTEGDLNIRGSIIDLDLKGGSNKLTYWRQLEGQLVEIMKNRELAETSSHCLFMPLYHT